MSKSYYYFGASLPLLQFESKPPMTIDVFLKDCEQLMVVDDFRTIETILSGENPNISNKVVEACFAFEHIMRNELAFHQAHKSGKSLEQYLRGSRDFDSNVKQAIEQAQGAKNPLEAEKILDKARWDFYDMLEVDHHYNFECILLYGLKLKILERYKHVIDSPVGGERYEELKQIDDIIDALI